MKKVKQLTYQKNNYIVTFDDGKQIEVVEDIVVKYRLVKDKELSIEEYKNLEKEISYSNYYAKLLKYINSYSKSKYEYVQYLKRIETPHNFIDDIITDLENKKYIDDLRYAKQATNYYLKQGYGKKMIAYKLKESHVESSYIEEALLQIDEEIYLNLIINLAQKKIKSLKVMDYKNKQKLINYLLNRGYDYEIINIALQNLIQE